MGNPRWASEHGRDDVEQLMLNARLRDELEPFLDESVDLVNVRDKPTEFENDYLASMLAWERAPVLRIAQWFSPQLELPALTRFRNVNSMPCFGRRSINCTPSRSYSILPITFPITNSIA